MTIWRYSSLALAVAATFPLPAAAQSNAELLKELKALLDIDQDVPTVSRT